MYILHIISMAHLNPFGLSATSRQRRLAGTLFYYLLSGFALICIELMPPSLGHSVECPKFSVWHRCKATV